MGHGLRPPPARAYDEYFRAYSVAMLPGRERENVSYGGKSTSAVSVDRFDGIDSLAHSNNASICTCKHHSDGSGASLDVQAA